ncbi:hypothetical protein TRFO_19223 [Tritrichomonas foetus]|uniref:Surface antigen BspA-like n=1 Tax=Tritrichomonas foetus TaxID=1144522 RepID=A0A1J4KJ27_9EUKA|nr:hypothetical protein TRFO_19223 [Tritrichomonas foetus]|eukprot:OHT11345.1 hypothetical protein TRFO_19223 [Tritrichomonas foetus]
MISIITVFLLNSCAENIVVSKSGIVDYVAPLAYEQCDSKTAVIGEGIILIGAQAFTGCSNLHTVTFPSTLEIIKNSAFILCTSLVSVVIPEGVTTIENSAFRACTALVSISLPSTLVDIGTVVFQDGVDKLTSIQFPNGNPIFSTAYNMIYTNTTLVMCSNAVTQITWWPDVTILKSHCFVYCKLIGSITFPSTLTTLESRSLYFMSSLISFELGESIISFSENTIENCLNLQAIYVASNNPNYQSSDGVLFTKNLEELYFYPISKPGTTYTIPANTKTISKIAFSNVVELERFEVSSGNTVFTASNGVLYSQDMKTLYRVAPKVSSFTIPNGIVTLAAGAFYTCMITQISFPSSVENIESSVFYYTQINTHITIPETVKNIGALAFFSNILVPSISVNCKLTVLESGIFLSCREMTTITLPNTIVKISSEAFYNCIKLVNINIPSSLIHIGDNAFYFCVSLPNIVFPETLLSIGASAFESCIAFTSLTIPASVKYIPALAFSTCTNTKIVTFESCNTEYHSSAFYSIPDFSQPICVSSKTFTASISIKPVIRSILLLYTFFLDG